MTGNLGWKGAEESGMASDLHGLAKSMVDALPHSRALGLKLVGIGDGTAEMTLPYDERLVGDPETGVIHGGAVSTLMDTCCGAAVMGHGATALVATIDLRSDYMRSATPCHAITARAECYHVTRSVAFTRAIAVDGQGSGLVATAVGAFNVEWA